ncbi:hypothetical protein, partial [Lonsdalea populi]|uniref:hypothetical protein n=3 Tax=Pectobacteriaceae TaxID=1903410 RepID=UPI001C6564F1
AKLPQLRWREGHLYLTVKNDYFLVTDSLIVTGKISDDRQRWLICKPMTLDLLRAHPGFCVFTYLNGGYSYTALLSHGMKL